MRAGASQSRSQQSTLYVRRTERREVKKHVPGRSWNGRVGGVSLASLGGQTGHHLAKNYKSQLVGRPNPFYRPFHQDSCSFFLPSYPLALHGFLLKTPNRVPKRCPMIFSRYHIHFLCLCVFSSLSAWIPIFFTMHYSNKIEPLMHFFISEIGGVPHPLHSKHAHSRTVNA